MTLPVRHRYVPYAEAAKADTSVEIVTNGHFDEDGLIALFVMIDPETALAHRDLLCDASHAGDFSTYRSRQTARIAFT